MLAVNVVQLILEITVTTIHHGFYFSGIKQWTELEIRMWLLFFHSGLTLINAFYLFADKEFHSSVAQVGLLRSIPKAFFQRY